MAARELLTNTGAVIGMFLLAIVIFAAITAPVLAPHDPIEISPAESAERPSVEHWMGTDILGRDVLSRVIYGARISLRLGLLAESVALVFGMTLGLAAGYYGRWVDSLIMRAADVFFAFPSFLLALTIAFALGPSLLNVMIAVGIAAIPGYARIARGSVLAVREHEYVVAARTVGCSDVRLMVRHIFPNVIAPIVVIFTVGVGWVIITASSLSFLGMGAQPPTPEWGALVNDGLRNLREAWWIASFPGLAIMVTVLAINLVGDGLRDAMDPRLRNIRWSAPSRLKNASEREPGRSLLAWNWIRRPRSTFVPALQRLGLAWRDPLDEVHPIGEGDESQARD